MLTNAGYTYDYLAPENLASPDAFVRNQALGIPEYRALIVNNQSIPSAEVAEVLQEKADDGLPLILIGPMKSQLEHRSLSSYHTLNTAIADLLSADNVYQIDHIDDLPGTLAELGIAPRVSLACSSSPVYPVWRSSADVDRIFFFNDQDVAVEGTATIAASGVSPHILNAWTGSQSPLLQYTATNSSLTIPISLMSNETLILALNPIETSSQCSFPSTSGDIHTIQSSSSNKIHAIVTGRTDLTSASGRISRFDPSLPAPLNLTTWNLVIEDWHSAPDRFAVETEITNHTFDNIPLVPWNQIDDSLNPTSGIGHYVTTFTVPSSSNATFSDLVGILTLPLIQHTARVYLDNEWLGPIDPVNPTLTLDHLESGRDYEIRIEVSTTLFNRIKTDADDVRVIGIIAGQRAAYKTMPYEEYGLVGSVILGWGEHVEVDC